MIELNCIDTMYIIYTMYTIYTMYIIYTICCVFTLLYFANSYFFHSPIYAVHLRKYYLITYYIRFFEIMWVSGLNLYQDFPNNVVAIIISYKFNGYLYG